MIAIYLDWNTIEKFSENSIVAVCTNPNIVSFYIGKWLEFLFFYVINNMQ